MEIYLGWASSLSISFLSGSFVVGRKLQNKENHLSLIFSQVTDAETVPNVFEVMAMESGVDEPEAKRMSFVMYFFFWTFPLRHNLEIPAPLGSSELKRGKLDDPDHLSFHLLLIGYFFLLDAKNLVVRDV
jgi:hypothetical protein